MMRSFIGIAVLLINSCVYDPPREGSEIIIENQTQDNFLILDSLPHRADPLLMYDTSLVNNRNYIFSRNLRAHAFGIATCFLEDQRIGQGFSLNRQGIKSFFLIEDSNAFKSYTTIIEQRLFKRIDIPLDEVRKDSANYLFIYPDSIYFTKQFDMLKRTK